MTIEDSVIPTITPPDPLPPARPPKSDDEVAFDYHRALLLIDDMNVIIAKPDISINIHAPDGSTYFGNDFITDAFVLNKMIDHFNIIMTYPEFSGFDLTPFENAITAAQARLALNV